MATSEATATEPATIPAKRTRRKAVKVAQPEPKSEPAWGTWRDLKASMGRMTENGMCWMIDAAGVWSKVDAPWIKIGFNAWVKTRSSGEGMFCRQVYWPADSRGKCSVWPVYAAGMKNPSHPLTAFVGVFETRGCKLPFLVHGFPAIAAVGKWFDAWAGPAKPVVINQQPEY